MKNLIFSAVLLMTAFSSWANNPNKSLKEIIQRELNKSDFMKEIHKSGELLVAFSVDDHGKIKVENSNASDQDLEAQFLTFLNNLELDPTLANSEEYKMRFIFRRY